MPSATTKANTTSCCFQYPSTLAMWARCSAASGSVGSRATIIAKRVEERGLSPVTDILAIRERALPPPRSSIAGNLVPPQPCAISIETPTRAIVPPHKLDPREFVGGIDGLAIACGGWGSRPANHSRRPQAANRKPHRAAVGENRPASSNRRAGAQRNSSPVLSSLGSAVLDLVLALVASLARQPDHRPGRDGFALAPGVLVSALAISIPGSLVRWAPEGLQGSPQSDRTDGP